MKNFLIPLLAAFALPTIVNAETFYLKCTITRGLKNNDKEIITFENPTFDTHQFTLNENNQSAVYFLAEKGTSRKMDNVNFNQESIDMKYIQGTGNSQEVIKISINRVTGGIIQMLTIGSQSMRLEGKCKKSDLKTLF